MKSFLLPLLTGWALLSANALHAAVLTQWTFETSTPANSGPHAAEIGTGTATGLHTSEATSYSHPVGNGSKESFSSDRWAAGDFYQFTFSTLGKADISLTFSQGSSASGPGSFEIFYSTGGLFSSTGITYAVFAHVSPNTATSFGSWDDIYPNSNYSYAFDLSSISALNDQATVSIRLQMIGTSNPSGGAVAATGSSRVDNVTIHYLTSIPEPGVALILPVTGILAFIRRKRAVLRN